MSEEKVDVVKVEFDEELYKKNLEENDFSEKLQDLRSEEDKKELEKEDK